jgi:hypothetical protein
MQLAVILQNIELLRDELLGERFVLFVFVYNFVWLATNTFIKLTLYFDYQSIHNIKQICNICSTNKLFN